MEILGNCKQRGCRESRRDGLADIDVSGNDRPIHGRANGRVIEIQLGAIELSSGQRNQCDAGARCSSGLPEDRHSCVKVGSAHKRLALDDLGPVANDSGAQSRRLRTRQIRLCLRKLGRCRRHSVLEETRIQFDQEIAGLHF